MRDLIFIKYRDRYLGYYVLAAILLIAGFTYSVNSDYKTVALAGSIITILPITNYLSKNEFRNFPFIELICLFYFIEFFYCYFFINEAKFLRITFNPEPALGYSLVGVLSFLTGAHFIKSHEFTATINFPANEKYNRSIYFIVILLLIVHVVWPGILQGLRLSQIIPPLQLFIIPYFILLARRKAVNMVAKLLSVLYAAVYLTKTIISSLLAPLLIQGIFGVFCYLVLFKKVSKLQVLFLIPLVGTAFLLSEVKSEYRSILNTAEDVNSAEKITYYKELILDRISGDDLTEISEESSGGLSTIERFANGFIYLSAVTEQSPASVPFYYGESYKQLLFKLIPRLIWPDKPRENAGQEIAHRYQLLDYDDTNTSFNIPILAEFYVNFGIPGIIIGMLVLGLLCGFLNSALNIQAGGNDPEIYGASARLSLLGLLIFQESNFSLLFGNLIMFILLYKFGSALIPRL